MSNNRNMSMNSFRDHTVVVQGNNYAPINAGFPEEDSLWLEKISQENSAYHKKRIFESKGPFLYESFRWILDNADFNKWRNTEKSGVFWIKGDPGKGKTMLLGGLIDNFEESPQIGNNLAYFFCQATDSRINTAAAVIGGLITSFIKQHHKLRSDIHTKYKDDFDKLNGPDRWYILRDMFEKVTQHSTLPNPVCVVDALDECEQEHGCKQLLRLIIETSCRVKWLISSRNIPEIERELQAIDSNRRLSLELKENAEYITKSVDLYINNSIQTIMALQGDEELQIKAANTLRNKANGTFLWVALVVEQLRDTKHRNVNNVLEEMPEGLENLYNLILQRLTKQEDKDAYQVLLSTVTAAERPLSLEELHTFVRSQWQISEVINDLRDTRDLVKDCGSFLSIQDNTVYFIHQSVKEYMMGTASTIIFPAGTEYQHYTMFKASLSAMSRTLKLNMYDVEDPGTNIKTISRPNPDPLAPIAYCCIFWVEHLLHSCESGASREKPFLKDGGTLHSFLEVKFLCWLESLALLRSLVPQGIDAIQKLKNIFLYKSETNRRVVGGLTNPRRAKNRYLFIHRDISYYLGMCIDYAYSFFHHYDDSHLRAFINDAYQFFYYCKEDVGQYPLQLYHSAIIFEDTHSAIYTTFQHIIRAEFKNTLTFIKRPQKRFSLVQNIKLNCRGSITSLLYSPDSMFLCALSDGGTVALCRTDTCSLVRVIELGTNEEDNRRFYEGYHSHFLAFSMDSNYLLSISRAGIVQVWAVACGAQMQNFSLNLDTIVVPDSEALPRECETIQEEVIALSHHGDLAASSCHTLSGTVISVKIWTIKTGKCISVIHQSHMPNVLDAAISPNLEMIALVDEKDVRVYSVQTGQEIKHMSHQSRKILGIVTGFIRYCRFSSDSKVLALKSTGVKICLWCTETWTIVRQIDLDYSSTGHFDISPNATMSVMSYGEATLIVSMDTGELLLNIQTHYWEGGATFSPDWTNSSLLASFNHDAIQIWQACLEISDERSKIKYLSTKLGCMAISPKSKYVAACDDRGNMGIWNGENGECIRVLHGKKYNWPPLPVFSPNLEYLLLVQEGDVQVWHVETGKPLHLLKGPGAWPNVSAAFSDDSRYIVAGYTTGQMKVWSVESGSCLYDNEGCHDTTCISKVAFSLDSKYIATASYDAATVGIWDWHTGKCVSQLKCELGIENSLAFSSDATVLVTITESISSYSSRPSYEAKFYDVTSAACLGHFAIQSNCLPLFDSTKDHVISDRFRFYKKSTWKHWDKIPQPKCSFEWEVSSRWIVFGEHRAFLVPRPFLAARACISDTLLALKSSAGELYIVQLPRQYII